MDGLAVMVLLRHVLPDGTSHFDWLLERPGRPEADLVAFRVAERVDQLGPDCGGFDALRLADHRRVYLTYEGPISGGRGSVTRLAEGRCDLREGPDGIRVALSFGGVARVFDGRPFGEVWRFVTGVDQVSGNAK